MFLQFLLRAKMSLVEIKLSMFNLLTEKRKTKRRNAGFLYVFLEPKLNCLLEPELEPKLRIVAPAPVPLNLSKT
jgi:hypothetical protein